MGLVRRLAALVVILALLAGIPILLLTALGTPWSHHIDWSGTLTGPTLITILGWICWAAWAWVAVCLVTEIIMVATHLHVEVPHVSVPLGSSWARPLATALLAGSSALGLAGPALAAPAHTPIAATTLAQPHTASPTTGISSAPAGTLHATAPSAVTAPAATATTVVPTAAGHTQDLPTLTVQAPHHGDHQSLWEIAERHLGDGMHWRAIWDLNRDKIADPDLIYPGEVLTMPAHSTGLHHQHQAPDPAPQPQPTPPHQAPQPTAPSHATTAPTHDSGSQGSGTGTSTATATHPGAPTASPSSKAPTASPSQRTATVTPPGQTAPSQTPPPTSAGVVTPTHVPSTQTEQGHPPGTTPLPSATTDAPTQDAWPDWVLPGLTVGGGAALAGAALMAVRARRKEAARSRRPGQVPAPVPAALVAVDKTIATVGDSSARTVAGVDRALRALATATHAAGAALPPLAAVSYTSTAMTLHLNDPVTALPAPWTPVSGTIPATAWTATATDLNTATATTDDGQAPWPLLITIGEEPRPGIAEEPLTWLLNLELAGGVVVSGDDDRVTGFVRFIVAEAATVQRCQGVRVDTVGVGTELATLGVNCHTTADDTTEDAIASAVGMIDRTRRHLLAGETPVTGRITHPDDEDWPARLLAVHSAAHDPHLGKLWDLVNTNPATATAIITTGTAPASGGTKMQLTTDGKLHLPEIGLTLTAPCLTAQETTGIGRLLSQADSPDHAHPEDIEAAQPEPEQAPHLADLPIAVGQSWQQNTGPTGLLRKDLTVPRVTTVAAVTELRSPTDLPRLGGASPMPPAAPPIPTTPAGEPPEPVIEDHAAAASSHPAPGQNNPQETDPATTGQTASDAMSVLPAPDEEYVATTPQDLDVLAPRVTRETRAKVLHDDPTLDDDLTAWADTSSPRPKLALLGPVSLSAKAGQGYDSEVTRRKAMLIEVAAYLATRPKRAATRDQMETDLNLTGPQIRKAMTYLRKWLGNTPDGDPYLPNADQSAAAGGTGLPTYQLHPDVLVDLDLFRRLRARGEATGPDGLTDLRNALNLVSGTPFSELRPRGWTWLLDGTRLDQTYLCAVVDTAHTVVTALIHQGHPHQAQRVAEHALLAAPDEEIPRLDLAAACQAQGNTRTAHHLVQDSIINQTDHTGLPTDLSPRTRELLNRLA